MRSPTTAALLASLAVVVACAVDLAGRSMARASWIAALGIDASPVIVALAAALAGAIAVGCLRRAGRLRPGQCAAIVLLACFPAGMAAQLSLGARLQSDGFYYFAFLRSMWFDGDLNLANDYRLLRLEDKPHLFTPTPTGYAQTAWSIGPAILASPFFGAGHVIARAQSSSGHQVAVDGTSYPYRQSLCVAGLFWGLVGLFFSFQLARRLASTAGAAVATTAVALGSFILWYLVKEPTMAHAMSLCAVAAFCCAWAWTRGGRSTTQWVMLGVLGGFMAAVRWQNILFVALPALDWFVGAVRIARTGDRPALVQQGKVGLIFLAGAVVGLSPQLYAWKAIYGSWFAVSPISPEIRWWDSRWRDVLWSSRNGLLAFSPLLYAGVVGVIALWRRDRVAAVAIWTVFVLMAFLNGAVADWWAGAAYGGRRFDSTLPLLIAGAAICFDLAASWAARHPRIVVGGAGLLLVVGNLTLMDSAVRGTLQLEAPNAVGDVMSRQAATLHRWVGYPFSYPVTLPFAWRNGISPAEADVLWPTRFLADSSRPYGRIDIGGDDGLAVREGWHPPENDQGTSFRWAARNASVRVTVDHAAPLRVQVRARAFTWPGAPPQQVVLSVNGHPQSPQPVGGAWEVVVVETPESHWRPGVNLLMLTFDYARRPSETGVSADQRDLAAAVDYVRIAVVP